MFKNKKTNLAATHSRNPSSHKSRKSRTSHPRLSLHPSPPKMPTRTPSSQLLSNPSSLEKRKKPKVLCKKGPKPKKIIVEQPTQQTLDSTGDGRWKEHLKLTFRSKNNHTKEISLHNSSLKCMEDIFQESSRKPAQSYTSMMKTFPKELQAITVLGQKQRVFLLDWLSFVSAELQCRRSTYHMSVAFVDNYLQKEKAISGKMQALGAGALLLAAKQEERGVQTYILNILSGNGSGLTRQEIIDAQSKIVVGLGFKLNFNTLSFWCDYFSQKWDIFLKKLSQKNLNLGNPKDYIFLRSPQGESYRYYREMMQLADTLIIHTSHRKYSFSQLSLAVLYLVIRIQTESKMTGEESHQLFRKYHEGFSRKASPIFNDRYNFNSIFNEFVADTCHFEITEIIGMIRWAGEFIDMGFTFDIDSRAYEQAQNYQQFLRFTHYSEHIRDYFLTSVV